MVAGTMVARGSSIDSLRENSMNNDERSAATTEEFVALTKDKSIQRIVVDGGTDLEIYAKAKPANKLTELPVNHSPKFAPVLHPTLRTGVETLVVAPRTWLHA